jgi:hypothetical protein
MIDRPITLPKPLSELVARALNLCEHMLPLCDVFYPFAAIYEHGRVGCVFSEDTGDAKGESQLIEQLQWRIIDTTTGSKSYSVLVYAATVNTQDSNTLDAIAVAMATPDHEERLLLYPYYKVEGKVVISPPIDAVTR